MIWRQEPVVIAADVGTPSIVTSPCSMTCDDLGRLSHFTNGDAAHHLSKALELANNATEARVKEAFRLEQINLLNAIDNLRMERDEALQRADGTARAMEDQIQSLRKLLAGAEHALQEKVAELKQTRSSLAVVAKQGKMAQERIHVAVDAASTAEQARSAAEERARRAEQARAAADERATSAEQTQSLQRSLAVAIGRAEAAERILQARTAELEHTKSALTLMANRIQKVQEQLSAANNHATDAELRASAAEQEVTRAWEHIRREQQTNSEAMHRVEQAELSRMAAEHNQTWALARLREAEEEIQRLNQALIETAQAHRASEAADSRLEVVKEGNQRIRQDIAPAATSNEPAVDGELGQPRSRSSSTIEQTRDDAIIVATNKIPATKGMFGILRHQLEAAVSEWDKGEAERFMQFEIRGRSVHVRHITEIDFSGSVPPLVIKCVLRGRQKGVSAIQVHSVLCALRGKAFAIEELEALTAVLKVRPFQKITGRQYKKMFDAEAGLSHVMLYRWEDLWDIFKNALQMYPQDSTPRP